MALFTKLFERDHNPYSLKSRWYKIVFNGDSATLISSDLKDVILSTTTGSTTVNVAMPNNFDVLDMVADYFEHTGTTTSVSSQIRMTGPDVQTVLLSNATRFKKVDLYVYGYFRG